MKRCAWVWIASSLCAVVLIAAMFLLTNHIVRLEIEANLSLAKAEQEQKIRLALWRLESEANAILVAENARPIETFVATDAWKSSGYISGLFESKQLGQLVIAPGAGIETKEKIAAILQSKPAQEFACPNNQMLGYCVANGSWGAETPAVKEINWQQNDAIVRKEAVSRQAGYNMKNANQVLSQKFDQEPVLSKESITDKNSLSGDFRAVWLSNELFLLRQSAGSRGQSLQGVWLNADELQKRLHLVIEDLFTNVSLLPMPQLELKESGDQVIVKRALDNPMALVALPFQLKVDDALVPIALSAHSPARSALHIAWTGMILAIIAGAALLWMLMRLSERRAAFVSAVTHELRTPLTTFQLYTDMLSSGMVKEESQRISYFETLRREADRLGHLVENVLAFAKIERGSARGGVKSISIGELLGASVERMTDRLQQAGLTLEYAINDDCKQHNIKTDPAAVDHILMNLADNAAKYAQPSTPAVVELQVTCDERYCTICLRDHGPGVSASEKRKIFQPFHKSAAAAAHSKPGVGLGLALSLRLAKEIHATLTCADAREGGAVFSLKIPF